jgi:hypothetical protein
LRFPFLFLLVFFLQPPLLCPSLLYFRELGTGLQLWSFFTLATLLLDFWQDEDGPAGGGDEGGDLASNWTAQDRRGEKRNAN